MTEDTATATASAPIEAGVAVYDHAGNELGVITSTTEEGFEVAIDVDIEAVDDEGYAEVADGDDLRAEQATAAGEDGLDSPQEDEPGQEFGEGYLMWRCRNCGEMGELEDGLPAECPNCGAGEVYKWRED